MTAPAPSERCHTFYGVTDLCTRCGGTMEDHYSAHVLEGERRATSPQYSALADRLDALHKRATEGPWAWDQRGEKVNEWGLGVAFDAAYAPLAGRFTDEDAQYVEYVCSHEAATCNYADPELICALRNAWPEISTALRTAEALEREREMDRKVIAWANNSLFGSHGYFLSKNGGPPDEHHLDSAIEELKTYGRQQWQRAEALEQRVKELEAILSGDATMNGIHIDGSDVTMGINHPLVHIMADSLAKMVQDNNYVEMRMTHKGTGDEYTLHCQRTSRPTPHELRKRAEARAEAAESALAKAREGALADDYVAWMRYVRHDNGVTTIEACDSDSPGAFQVYRALLELTQGKR